MDFTSGPALMINGKESILCRPSFGVFRVGGLLSRNRVRVRGGLFLRPWVNSIPNAVVQSAGSARSALSLYFFPFGKATG